MDYKYTFLELKEKRLVIVYCINLSIIKYIQYELDKTNQWEVICLLKRMYQQ